MFKAYSVEPVQNLLRLLSFTFHVGACDDNITLTTRPGTELQRPAGHPFYVQRETHSNNTKL